MGVTVMNPVGGGSLATSTPQIMRLLPGATSAAEICFRYVLATPGVTCALSGMNSSEQLEQNVRVASRKTPMTVKQQERMRERLEQVKRGAGEFCTACGYCMPCEEGVDIPGHFALLNQVKFFGRLDWAREQYTQLKQHRDGDKSAETCIQCGSCEAKCPNNVPIMEQLVQVDSTLG